MNDIVLNTLPENEILRYLGCPPDDENTLALVRPCAEDLCKTARPRTLRRAFPITVQEEGVVIGENALFLPGQDLVRVLIGCSRAVLFCATLGSAVDSMLRKEQLCDMTRSVILDSCASVAIEAVCDQIEEAVRADYPNAYLSSRYSPGYGDVPISIQRNFLTLLDAPRKIGLCATDSSILTPRKSVTAIIGLSNHPIEKPKKNCATCRMRDRCAFRKKEEHCGLSQTD